MRLTFDSNILIYTLSRADPRHAAAASLLARATRADCVQTLQSLAECFRVITTKLRFDPRDAKRGIDGFRFALPVRTAEEDDLDQAMRAVEHHHLSSWDAMLWATARRAGCRLLLSEDFQDGRDLGGVLFVNPLRPRQPQADRPGAAGACGLKLSQSRISSASSTAAQPAACLSMRLRARLSARLGQFWP